MVTPLNRRLRIAATVIVSIAGLIGLAFLATYYYLKPTLPDVAVLRDVRLQVPLRVFSRDGKLLAQIGEQRRVPVTWEQIPPVVVQAVLAAEDDRFFQHPGVDWQGIARAVVVAATTMEASQGGSTLTQQLVRTTLITNEKQLRRKLREVFLALSLENELSKEEIFTLFVNTQFLGQRSYGFAAAAETYYGKWLGEVDAAEAALLAGILQAPSRQNPVASVEQATERRTYVLRRMRELGYLDEAAWQAAMDKPVARGQHGPRVQVDAPYVGEMVRLVLFEKYGDRIYSEGFQVVTTVDSRLQRAADVALRSAVLEYDRRHGWRGAAGHVEVAQESDEALAGADRGTPGDRRADSRDRRAHRRRRGDGRGAQRHALPPRHGRHPLGAHGDATPKSPRDVLKIGDVVYVLPVGRGRGAARAGPGGPGRLRRARPARRLDRRAVGRLRLRRLEVQPRGPGAPPAGILVQALHLLGGARGRAARPRPSCSTRRSSTRRRTPRSASARASNPASRARPRSRRTGARATTPAGSTARRGCATRSRARATS